MAFLAGIISLEPNAVFKIMGLVSNLDGKKFKVNMQLNWHIETRRLVNS